MGGSIGHGRLATKASLELLRTRAVSAGVRGVRFWVSALLVLVVGCAPRWQWVEPAGTSVRIQMPGNPSVKPVSTSIGDMPATWVWHKVVTGGGVGDIRPSASYVLGIGSQNARPAFADLMNQAVKAFSEGCGNAVERRTLETVSGFEGGEFVVRDPSGTSCRVRLLARESRLYLMVVLGDPDVVDSPAWGERFFRSFEAVAR